MFKVYIGKLLNFSYLPLLFPNLGAIKKETLLFTNKAFDDLNKPFVKIVQDSQKADFLLLPHHLNLVKDNDDYLFSFSNLAKRLGKKIVIFDYGDSDKEIEIDNALVFRTSQYR